MNIRNFGKALLCKSFWRSINGVSFWSATIRRKYMENKDLTYWYRVGTIGKSQGSAIWNNFRRIKSFILENLYWYIHNGKDVLIGHNHIIGLGEDFCFPRSIISALHRSGIFYWNQLIEDWYGAFPIRKNVQSLGISQDYSQQWDNILISIRGSGICNSDGKDQLSWRGVKCQDELKVKEIYLVLARSMVSPFQYTFPISLWKIGVLYKIIHFSWLVFHNKILAWENLQKRHWQGPSICLLCKNGNENSNHIFLTCSYTYQLWKELAAYLGFHQIDHTDVKEAIRWWGSQKVAFRSIPLLLFWYVWKKKNNAIFREGKGSYFPLSDQIISMYLSIPKKESANKILRPSIF